MTSSHIVRQREKQSNVELEHVWRPEGKRSFCKDCGYYEDDAECPGSCDKAVLHFENKQKTPSSLS